jgi:hypothetical protein
MNLIERDAAEAAGWIERHLGHDTTTAPAAANISTSTPGGTMTNLLTDAKSIFHDGITKLEGLDEAAIGVVEAIKVNPTAVSITNTLASVAHLPDPSGLLGGADTLLKSLAAALSAGAAATAPEPATAPATDTTAGQPSYAPAGPVVGGQA